MCINAALICSFAHTLAYICEHVFLYFFAVLECKFTHGMNFYGSVIHDASRYCKFCMCTYASHSPLPSENLFRSVYFLVRNVIFFSLYFCFLVPFLTEFLPFLFCTHSSCTHEFFFLARFPIPIHALWWCEIFISHISQLLVIYKSKANWMVFGCFSADSTRKKKFRPTHNSYHITQ